MLSPSVEDKACKFLANDPENPDTDAKVPEETWASNDTTPCIEALAKFMYPALFLYEVAGLETKSLNPLLTLSNINNN